MIDRSNGWDAIADTFMTMRSAAGVDVVQRWARQLPRTATVVDVGCGSGDPISRTLIDAGFTVFGIDASPRLVGAFRSRFPDHRVACETAEDSAYFDRTFDAAIAIGLVFLLSAKAQQAALVRMASAVGSGGRILFSAPEQPCQWTDTLTGRPSLSLGTQRYARIMAAVGQRLQTTCADGGGNHYLSFAGEDAPFTA